MAAHDLEIGMREDAVNAVLAHLYGRPALRQKLFAGTRTGQSGEPDMSWSVEQCPTIRLNGPDDDFWTHAVKRTPPIEAPYRNALVIAFPELEVTYHGKPLSKKVDALCTLDVYSGSLTVVPVAASIDLTGASDWDRFFYEKVIGPKALNLSATMLGGITVPHVKFADVSFGTPALAVGDGALVAGLNLADRLPTTAPTTTDTAEKFGQTAHFYAVVGPEAVRRVAQAQLDILTGKSHTTSGQAGFVIGKADYRAGVALNSATATVDSVTPDQVGVAAEFTAWADAEVELNGLVKEVENVGDAIAHFFSSY
ncbi:hypothetical protein [Kitasatospora griseola]|uniref:hypothetical protein n=1 Tax=Kitasatospora griseola TaxID=2064 RepID=UPI0037F3FB07